MKKGFEALFSKYIIDGVTMDSTPADMLRECFTEERWKSLFPVCDAQPETVIDEDPDRDPSPLKYSASEIGHYLSEIRNALASTTDGSCPVSIFHPFSSARILIAESVLKFLWRRSSLRLDELSVSMSVIWDTEPVGYMAAFYRAVESASSYIYDLGLHLDNLQFNGLCGCESKSPDEPAGRHEMNFEILHSDSCSEPVSDRVVDRPDSVLIYIPFDTCSHKLGGSLFHKILRRGDENGPEIVDPDYFIDSYEVVHDLVEDGVVLSGVTVGRGGLIAAVDRILGDNYRIDLDLGGISRAYMEEDNVRILLSEIPGALIQIPESERGYIDAQLLLQDIAYYTIGQPVRCRRSCSPARRIRLSKGNEADLSRILYALINGQVSEDPDISCSSEGSEDLPKE